MIVNQNVVALRELARRDVFLKMFKISIL